MSIFRYRLKSLEPFTRNFIGHKILDMLNITENKDKCIVTGITFY